MQINIYYGGRGVLDDPTLYVIDKIQEVLQELRVTVQRYNIYESKNSISTLPQTLKEADGVILATTVEWMGIGGYMQQFLDACWLYGDKEKISRLYMAPAVMSITYGEREAMLTLNNAWEMLGGMLCTGLCGYVKDLAEFKQNEDYNVIIEKKAENLYRNISQKMKNLPTSNQAVKASVQKMQPLDLTPQESEQLSKYVSDDGYVKKQKEDIEELTSMFKDMLGKTEQEENMKYINELQSHFVPQQNFVATYLFMIGDRKKPLIIEVNSEEVACHYGQQENVDIIAKMSEDVMEGIIRGRMTFQRAFMTGEMTAKGNFKTLRMLDKIFIFG